VGRTAKLHRLTALVVKRYAEAATQARPLHDGGGLYLRKREASARWYLRLSDPATGAQQWHRLFPDDPAGDYPHKTLADARAESRRLWDLRSTGVDPRVQRAHAIGEAKARADALEQEAQRRLSVKALFDRWAATDLQPRTRADGKRAGRRDGGQFTRDQFERRVFPKLGNRAVAEVARGEWIELLDAVKSEGKLRTANVLLADLKQMLRFALARDLLDRNPLETVLKRDVGGASVERDRVLSREEVRHLSAALPTSGLSGRTCAGIWLILATGVRVGELMGATWAATSAHAAQLAAVAQAHGVKLGIVDLERCTWHLTETKNQREHSIHLSPFAIEQFQRLADLHRTTDDGRLEANPWVFPNHARSAPTCVKSFGKQIADRQCAPERRLTNRTRNTAALVLQGGRWTAHDLRRTAATLMAELGVSGDVIDECLNHMIESRIRRVYIRDRRIAAQAQAFDLLSAELSALAREPGDVQASRRNEAPVQLSSRLPRSAITRVSHDAAPARAVSTPTATRGRPQR
jgi:integrase